jgi:hypothetical protein
MTHDEFSNILTIATSKVARDYFSLNVYKQESVYRERVYCYELYHQMRLLWPPESRFFLNGEVDKMGHHYLKAAGLKGLKPDFLVHIPGDWGGNHIVMEVKPSTVKKVGLAKDLKSLDDFVQKGDYGRAILLLFGTPNKSSSEEAIKLCAKDVKIETTIEVWQHSKPSEEASLLFTLMAD